MPTKYEQPYPRGADAKHILASLLTQECSTHLSTKWVNARNEEVKECNEMPTKGKGDKGIRMAVKAFGLVIRIQKGREYPGCRNPFPYFWDSSVRDNGNIDLGPVQTKGLANSDAELYGGNCVQDVRDPSILHRYRANSRRARVRKRIQAGKETQNLWTTRITQAGTNNRGLLTSVMLGKLGVPRQELYPYCLSMIISVPEEVAAANRTYLGCVSRIT